MIFNKRVAFARTRMSAPPRFLVLASLLVVACTSIEPTRMRNMSVDELADAFRPCVGPYGVHAELARLALRESPDSGRLEQVVLSSSGVVADGFNHELFVDRERTVAYVLETGGFAGVRKWYGPLTLETTCTKEAH